MGGTAMSSISLSLVEFLGVVFPNRGADILAIVKGAPTEGPMHGFLVMAFFRWPSLGGDLFLAVSQNLLAKTFLMLARHVSHFV